MDPNYLQYFLENSYQLVLWPEVQELMEYPWFRKECFLYHAFDDQLYFDSSYFVPVKRLVEVDPVLNNLFSRAIPSRGKPKP